MKRFLMFIGVLSIVSCQNDIKNYARVEGKLNVSNMDTITIQGKDFFRAVPVAKDGSFSDTLTINKGVFALSNGKDRLTFFLKNGYDLELKLKGEKLEEGAQFKGNGSSTNNYMENIRSFYLSSFANPKSYFSLNKEAYAAKLSEARGLLQTYKDEGGELDSLVLRMADRNENMFFGYIEANYDRMSESYTRLGKGKLSPTFTDYENHAGGKTSLSDLKGSYVYIDVWATWCAPCKAEIPALKEIEKEFQAKNIKFVSISVDKDGDYETWKSMVKDEALSGLQLIADNNFESDFIKAYGINAIPRFILIDPDGNIYDADAPRPSNPELKELFISLDI